jgi:hypothetical protein
MDSGLVCTSNMQGESVAPAQHSRSMVELYANKVVDGKVQRVVVLRCRWDRASWLADQEVLGKLVLEVLASPSSTEEVRVH